MSISDISKRNRVILIICVILALAGIIPVYITFNYIDAQSLTAWAVNNWDLLIQGRMGDFYTDKIEGGMGFARGAVHPQIEGGASFLMFIPQMLWCFPLWITHYFGDNINVGTVGCVMWYKLFLFVMTGVTAYVCFRIVRRLSQDMFRALIAAILVIASVEVLLSTGYTGQDEIVYLAFTMLAIDCLLLKKYKMFIFWSACAVTCCPLIIIPLALALILKEKSILKIGLGMLIMVLPTLVWAIGSSGMTRTYISQDDQMARVLDYLSIPSATEIKASVFVIFLCVLFFACFLKQDVSDRKLIWYVSLPIIWLSFIADTFYYRTLLYIPFLIILITLGNQDDLDLKLLLITVLQYVRFFTLQANVRISMNTFFVVDTKWAKNLCAKYGSMQYEAYDSMIEKFLEGHNTLSGLMGAFGGLTIGIVLILLWITYSDDHEEKTTMIKIYGKEAYLILYSAAMLIFMYMFWHITMRCF